MKRLLPFALLFTSSVLAQTPAGQTPGAQTTPAPKAQTQKAPTQNAPAPAVPQNLRYTAVQKLVKVTTSGGRTGETLVDSPLTVLRGDLLVEEVTVQNVGRLTLPQVTVSMPMPAGTSFTGEISPKSARVNLSYSTDGGRNYTATPQRMTSVTENGRTVMKAQAAALTDVTHVRWMVAGLKPGESLKLSYRVRVD